MAQRVLHRINPQPGFGLQAAIAAMQNLEAPAKPIAPPPEDAAAVLKESWDSFTFDRFTVEDAFELGHLLYARLLPWNIHNGRPTLISIALANNGQVVFQTAVGSGVVPDNERWVVRKRALALRWGHSSWFLRCKFKNDPKLFQTKFGLSDEQAESYALNGGAVPIFIKGVEGPVAVVVVSGMHDHEDHGAICDVIRANWQ